jgi:ABC-type multidrug transport system ATPase subunit
VKKLNEKEGVSFLLAEQNTNIALRYATYGYILESGRVVMDGDAKDLRENEDVKEFYLGVGGEGRRSFKNVKALQAAQALAGLNQPVPERFTQGRMKGWLTGALQRHGCGVLCFRCLGTALQFQDDTSAGPGAG